MASSPFSLSKKAKKSNPNQLSGAGTITVTVLKAVDLAAMDSNGKSDPYCVIESNVSSQVFQTHTIKKTLNPVWNESFPLYIGELEPKQTITVSIYDRDLVGQDFLGAVELPLKQLIDTKEDQLEDWYTLKDEPTKNYNKQEKKPGKIQIKFHYPKGASLRGIIKLESPTKYYKMEKQLGKGAFAKVKKATKKETGKECAIKIVKKKKMNEEQKTLLTREIQVMAKLHHPNIVEMFEAYDTAKFTYIILELIEGGELFDEIISRPQPYYESDAANLIQQVLRGIEYMHSMGICHRDLKPENLLLSSDKKTVKISDFGLSKDFSKNDMKTACGTAIYVAPEVLMGSTMKYDMGCDIWSLGVITYVLMSGCIPFEGKTEPQVFENILNCNYGFPSAQWKLISAEAKDFISKIFIVDPKKRMTATDCLEHAWLNKSESEHPKEALNKFKENLKEFSESVRSFYAPKDEVEDDDNDGSNDSD